MSLYIYTTMSKVHGIAARSSLKRSPPGIVCRHTPYQHGHVWNEHIGSLQSDLAQTYKVHLLEWNTSSPLGLMPPRPLRQSEVVSPSKMTGWILRTSVHVGREWSYIPARAAIV